MRRLAGLLLLAGLLASPARAGIILRWTETSGFSAQTSEATLAPGRAKVVVTPSGASAPSLTILYRANPPTIFLADHTNRTYRVIDAVPLRRLRQELENGLGASEGSLYDMLPPLRKRTVERIGLFRGALDAPRPLPTVPTGTAHRVGAFACQGYTQKRDGAPYRFFCVGAAEALGIPPWGEELLRGISTLLDEARRLGNLLDRWKAGGDPSTEPASSPWQLPNGFPVKVSVMAKGVPSWEFVLDSVGSAQTEERSFALPPGLRRE